MGICVFDSYLGKIAIYEEENFITKIILNPKNNFSDNSTPLVLKTKMQIEEYLLGKRKSFDLPYIIEGTDFQRKILTEITKIPYGEKWSYKAIAKKAGYDNASRACGTVCKNNKLPIIIPCHRVIKSDGSLGRYNGGSDTKRELLDLENNL